MTALSKGAANGRKVQDQWSRASQHPNKHKAVRNVDVKKSRMTTVFMLTGLRLIISDRLLCGVALRFSDNNVNLCLYATPFRAMNCKQHTVNVGFFFFFLQWPVIWQKMPGNEQSAAKPFGYKLMSGWWIIPVTIHPFSSVHARSGLGGSWLSKMLQASFSPDTLSSSSWRTLRRSQASRDM